MILAIDPGIKGALAAYDPDLNYLVTKPLPTRWKMVNGQKRYEIDTLALRIELIRWAPDTIILEEPHGMPGAGAVQQFNFGLTCGAVATAVENYASGVYEVSGRDVKIIRVSPSTWKTQLQVPSDKNRARAMAAQCFPEQKEQFKNAADEGRAEAALLAAFVVLKPTPKQKERTPVKKRTEKKAVKSNGKKKAA